MNRAKPTNLVRHLAERLLGRIVLVRRLPAQLGSARIVVSGRVGGLKYLFRSSRRWDPELLRIASKLVRTGDHVWDVGANVGLFALAASHHAGSEGSVLAMEADHDAISLLFATVRGRASSSSAVTVLPTAINDTDGVVRFAIARRARAANAITGYGSTQTGGVLEVRTLPAMRLDSLLDHFAPPTVLKIDVEGAELVVLRGAIRVLAEFKPRIYCEVTGGTRTDASNMLQGLGYQTFDGESYGTENPREVGAGTTNMVAIPLQIAELQRRGI